MCSPFRYTKTEVSVSLNASLDLTECELRALSAFAEYGFDAFIKVYEEKLGTVYMREHKPGLKKLFETIKKEVSPKIAKCDEIRKDLQAPSGRFA